MLPHPVRLSTMPWTRHIPNTNLLILIMQSKSNFHYLPIHILYCNSQNSYLVIVFDNWSVSIISSDLYGLVLRLQTEEYSPYGKRGYRYNNIESQDGGSAFEFEKDENKVKPRSRSRDENAQSRRGAWYVSTRRSKGGGVS